MLIKKSEVYLLTTSPLKPQISNIISVFSVSLLVPLRTFRQSLPRCIVKLILMSVTKHVLHVQIYALVYTSSLKCVLVCFCTTEMCIGKFLYKCSLNCMLVYWRVVPKAETSKRLSYLRTTQSTGDTTFRLEQGKYHTQCRSQCRRQRDSVGHKGPP